MDSGPHSKINQPIVTDRFIQLIHHNGYEMAAYDKNDFLTFS